MQDQPNKGKAVDTQRQNYIFLYIILGIVLLAGLIILFKSSLFDKRTVNAKILKNEIFLNEPLVYSDNTQGAEKWLWEFGNGDRSTTQTGIYHFKKPGAYIVRVTVDDKMQQQFPIDVKEPAAALAPDTVLSINGPTQGIVNEEVRLGAQGQARVYEWSFGETGRVDVKGPTALYTYHTAGVYTVKLRTDNSSHPVYHKIYISNPDVTVNPIVEPGEGQAKVIDDIRAHLQAIARGADFNKHYYYLVRRYFCGDEKVVVNVEDNGQKKQTDFYSYCMRLTFGGGISVDQAQITLKPNSNCSSLLTVIQHTTNVNGIKRR